MKYYIIYTYLILIYRNMQFNQIFRSPNFQKRTKPIKYIILHYTEMTFSGALEILCNKSSGVSSHYLVKEDGKIFNLVEDENIAWHAGLSLWKGQEKLNQNSIGIEIDNLGTKNFVPKQVNAVIKLCNFLRIKYNIDPFDIIGHSDIAPSRKIDPGIFFPWNELAKHNMGLWLDKNQLSKNHDIVTESSKIAEFYSNLSYIGYDVNIDDINDNKNNFALRAFLMKYFPESFNNFELEYLRNAANKYVINNQIYEAAKILINKLLT